MALFLFYLILLSFYTEYSLGFELEKLFGLSMGFSLKNISLFALALAWFVSVRKQRQLLLYTNINKYIFCLIIIILLSLLPVFTGYVHSKAGIISDIVKLKRLINPWLLFFLVSHIINKEDDCRKAIWGLIGLLFINTITTILDSYGLTEFGTQGKSIYAGRATGFTEANQYAAFIVLLIAPLMTSTFLEKDVPKRLLAGLLFFICFFGLISTVSRGGYVAFLVSLLVFFYLANKKGMLDKKMISLSIALLCIILPIFYFISPQGARDVIDKKVFAKQSSIEEYNPWASEQTWVNKYSSRRTAIWADVLEEFLNKPIIGLGLNGYEQKRRISTHSDYLKYLVDHGIFGFSLYLMICFGILTYMYKAYLRSNNDTNIRLYIGYLAGASGYFVAMITVNLYEPRDIFWLYTAVMYKYTYLEVSNNA